jgi:hypothetical protein
VLTLKVDQAEKIADIRLSGLANSFKTKSGSEKTIYCSMTDGSIKLMTSIKLDGSEVTYLDFQKTFCEELPFYGGFNLYTLDIRYGVRTHKKYHFILISSL